MESKEYFEKVMQDYNQNRKGRSLRKYCKDEAVDYDWLIQYKKNYPLQEKQQEPSQDAFIFFYPKVVIMPERDVLDISLWEDAIGFRQEDTSLPRIWHLCSGCWKVAN